MGSGLGHIGPTPLFKSRNQGLRVRRIRLKIQPLRSSPSLGVLLDSGVSDGKGRKSATCLQTTFWWPHRKASMLRGCTHTGIRSADKYQEILTIKNYPCFGESNVTPVSFYKFLSKKTDISKTLRHKIPDIVPGNRCCW